MISIKKQSDRKVENCRLCRGALGPVALSLGEQPISNRLPREAQAAPRYPLEVALCQSCGLVQLVHHIDAEEHFHDDYTYLSGASKTWIEHCAEYADDVSNKYGVAEGGLIVEIGSNDGTLLNALQKNNHRVLGVEPSSNVAGIANNNGAPTISAFFNHETAARIKAEHGAAKFVIGNNVLAHVPDTNEFLLAARDLIADDGVLCFEFPHFINIIDKMYFDTIYHEHYTYLGVGPLAYWARHNGMNILGVDEQSTHGGTLRVLMKRGEMDLSDKVNAIIEREAALQNDEAWRGLAARLEDWRNRFRQIIEERRSTGKRIAGYAAASKATVLLNYLGLSSDDIEYCCDASPLKQNRYIPGANIPIVSPDRLKTDCPDAVIIFAWNIFDELRGIVSNMITKPVEIVNPFPDIEISVASPETKP